MSSPTSLSERNSSGLMTVPLRWWPQIAAVLLIIVEMCWVLPWYQTVMRISHSTPTWASGLVLGGVMLASFALAQAMENLRLLRNIQLAGLALALVFSLWFAEQTLLQRTASGVASGLAGLDPGFVLVLFFVLWLWWRGLTLARQVIRPMMAWRRFELGLLLFMAHLVVQVQFREAGPGLLWYMSFLLVGFLAVIFARIAYVGISKGVTRNPFDRRWLAGTLGTLLAAIAAAALLGSLLTGQYALLLELLAQGFRLLVAVVLLITAIPGLILSNFLGPLIPWLQRIFSRRTVTQDNEFFGPYPLSEWVVPETASVPQVLQSICFWGIVIVLLVVLFLRVRKVLIEDRRREVEEPESLLRRGEAGKLLRKALQDALDDLAARLRPAQRLLAAARVRRIYSQLLDLCAELDLPRPAACTPVEFLPKMGEIFSELPGELEQITQAYVKVRYGEYPERREEIAQVETAWQRISEAGKRLKKAGMGKLKTAEMKDVQRTGV